MQTGRKTLPVFRVLDTHLPRTTKMLCSLCSGLITITKLFKNALMLQISLFPFHKSDISCDVSYDDDFDVKCMMGARAHQNDTISNYF